MKKSLILMFVILVVAFGLTNLSAQTRKTKKKTSSAAKSDVTNKTRARRMEQTAPAVTPVEQQSSSSDVPKPEANAEPKQNSENEKSGAQSTASAGEQDQLPKPKEQAEPATESTDSTPKDVFAQLKDQIETETDPSEGIRLRLKLVEEFANADRKTEALAELRSITSTDVFDPQSFYNAGNSFARLGDTDGAVEAYRKAIEQRKGRYSRAQNNLGVVLLRAGRWDESYAALLSALKLENFHYPEAGYNLGRLYAARGQNDLAVREWRRVLAIDPKHSAAAEALRFAGSEGRVNVEPVRGASTRANAEATAKTSSAGPNRIAPAKPISSKPALSSSPRSLVLDPTSFDFLQRARNSTEKGNTLDAIDSYKRLLSRQRGYFALANLELSFALLNLKRYDEARGNLQMVVNRDGTRFPISYFHLARIYELKGDLKQAEVWYSQAAAAFGTQNGQFLLDLSRVREKQGDFKGALEAMEQSLLLMRQQGQEPSWSNERLTALRQKVATAPK
jgi:tetratricopeptide (TPR) repeat protein